MPGRHRIRSRCCARVRQPARLLDARRPARAAAGELLDGGLRRRAQIRFAHPRQHRSTPAGLLEQAQRDGFEMLSINVDYPGVQPARGTVPHRARAAAARAAAGFSSPRPSRWKAGALRAGPSASRRICEDAVSHGARAVKVWKNIGMSFRDQQRQARDARRSGLRPGVAPDRSAGRAGDRPPGRAAQLLAAARPDDDRERPRLLPRASRVLHVPASGDAFVRGPDRRARPLPGARSRQAAVRRRAPGEPGMERRRAGALPRQISAGGRRHGGADDQRAGAVERALRRGARVLHPLPGSDPVRHGSHAERRCDAGRSRAGSGDASGARIGSISPPARRSTSRICGGTCAACRCRGQSSTRSTTRTRRPRSRSHGNDFDVALADRLPARTPARRCP